MIGAEMIRWSGRSKPQSSSSQRLNACTDRHRRLDVVLERLLDAAGERRQHEHRLEVLRVEDLHPGIAVLVLGMVRHAVDLHQRRRVDTLGDLAAEQQIQAARLDDRVERRVRDEVVDLAAHDGQGALAVGDHLHAAALELLGQVPGAASRSSRSSGCRRRSPCSPGVMVVSSCHGLSGGKFGLSLLEEAGDALDEVGPLHATRASASRRGRWPRRHPAWCLRTPVA